MYNADKTFLICIYLLCSSDILVSSRGGGGHGGGGRGRGGGGIGRARGRHRGHSGVAAISFHGSTFHRPQLYCLVNATSDNKFGQKKIECDTSCCKEGCCPDDRLAEFFTRLICSCIGVTLTVCLVITLGYYYGKASYEDDHSEETGSSDQLNTVKSEDGAQDLSVGNLSEVIQPSDQLDSVKPQDGAQDLSVGNHSKEIQPSNRLDSVKQQDDAQDLSVGLLITPTYRCNESSHSETQPSYQLNGVQPQESVRDYGHDSSVNATKSLEALPSKFIHDIGFKRSICIGTNNNNYNTPNNLKTTFV